MYFDEAVRACGLMEYHSQLRYMFSENEVNNVRREVHFLPLLQWVIKKTLRKKPK